MTAVVLLALRAAEDGEMSGGYKSGGLELDKYVITKTNGHSIDPEALYFILRYDADPHARVALAAYAQSVRADNPQLADDLAWEVQAASNKAAVKDSRR